MSPKYRFLYMIRMIKRFFKKINNIIRWILVLWKDEDWDYSHIFNILKFKLENKVKYFTKSKLTIDTNYVIEKLKLCIKLIDRIQTDYYEDEYKKGLKYLQQKYPSFYNKVNTLYKDKTNSSKAIFISTQNQERAKNLLFKLISHHIYFWWD